MKTVYVFLSLATISFLQAMEPKHIELAKKYEAKAKEFERPNETIVSMYGAGSIVHDPKEDKKILSTIGLGGCTAAALIMKCNCGSTYAAMTHYPVNVHHAYNKEKLHDVFMQGVKVCSDKNVSPKSWKEKFSNYMGYNNPVKEAHLIVAAAGEGVLAECRKNRNLSDLPSSLHSTCVQDFMGTFYSIIEKSASQNKIDTNISSLMYSVWEPNKPTNIDSRSLEVILDKNKTSVMLYKNGHEPIEL